jgi:Zn-dependent protease with chaperone function
MPNVEPANAFTGGIKKPPVGIFYTAGLLGVTVVMAILPLIYLALIGGVVYLTFYHATHNLSRIMGSGAGVNPRVWLLKGFLYATPIFMGSVLAFFMVKPFFARRIDQHQPYALNPQAEPALYEFIWRICAIVGAPMPSLIELDCRVNASAGLRHGFRSFFGRDLVLTIGLPLVAGLTARELAGVLAHEFGHFTQGTALRLNYIINRIDGWFARLIWERDSWDEWLEELSQNEESGGVALMACFAQFGVWLSRLILTGLLLFGHAFSCFLSRRMEFHADQFEIQLAGSAAFESASERLNALNILQDAALHQMQVTWNLNKRLPDNLPQFIVNIDATQTGTKVRKAMKGQLGFVKTGLFHTHPSDAERVREARAANAPGIVTLDAPATDLFENFPVPARIVTTLFYEGIGLPLPMAKLYAVDVPQVKTEEQAQDDAQVAAAAVDRFFSGVVTPLRPIFPRVAPKIEEAQVSETLGAINALPAQIAAISDQVAEACAAFDHADKMMLAAAQEDSGAAEGIELAAWREQREQARRSLRSVLDAYENRIESALALANTDAFARLSKSAVEIRQRVTAAREHLLKMQPLLKSADSLRVATASLVRRDGREAGTVARLREQMADYEAALREIPCPAHFGQAASLFEFFKALPAAQEPFLAPRAEALAHLPMAAYTRILGDLVLLAEEIIEQMNTRKVMRVQAA